MAFKLIPAEFLLSGKLVGQYTLTGVAIQSPNYVPGVSGWAIFGNGNAEFNNGTFRGLIQAAQMILQGSSGEVLVYSGPPAAGNLFASISAVSTTDSHGNPVLPQLATYANDGNGTFIQMNAGLFVFGNTTFPTEAAGAGAMALQPGGALQIQSGTTGGAMALNQDGTVQIFRNALIGSNTLGGEETWHVVGSAGQPAFVNSFTAGGTAPRFQIEPTGRVRLSGAVNTGAATVANTTMFTLPAGYVPSRQFGFATVNNLPAYTLGTASVQVTTGGAVQLVPAGVAGKFVLLDGICFELG